MSPQWPTGMWTSDRLLMDKHIKTHPWLAQAPTSCKPHLVEGDHCSVRLRMGWRVWAFRTEAERDRFIVACGGKVFP